MQFSLTTDYMIRTVMFLANQDGPVKASVISQATNVSEKYIKAQICKLVKSGILKSYHGIAGGFALNKCAGDITLYDIISLTEANMHINKCIETNTCTVNSNVDWCPVHRFYEKLQDKICNALKNMTIQQLLDEKT